MWFFWEGVWQLIRLCFNEAFEEFDFCGLGVAVIHHLVEQFVDHDKVVANGFFLDIFEVAFENIDKGVEEGEDHDSIVILFRNGHQI